MLWCPLQVAFAALQAAKEGATDGADANGEGRPAACKSAKSVQHARHQSPQFDLAYCIVFLIVFLTGAAMFVRRQASWGNIYQPPLCVKICNLRTDFKTITRPEA